MHTGRPDAGVAEEAARYRRLIHLECEHVVGDMRDLRLGRSLDAAFIHDAIDYVVTLEDLRAALATVAAHLRPDGLMLLCPDHVRETFASGTAHGGHDDDGRGTAARHRCTGK